MEQDALMLAAQFNENASVIRELLKNGANPKNKSVLGKTALDFAKKHKNDAAVSVLSNY